MYRKIPSPDTSQPSPPRPMVSFTSAVLAVKAAAMEEVTDTGGSSLIGAAVLGGCPWDFPGSI